MEGLLSALPSLRLGVLRDFPFNYAVLHSSTFVCKTYTGCLMILSSFHTMNIILYILIFLGFTLAYTSFSFISYGLIPYTYSTIGLLGFWLGENVFIFYVANYPKM